MSKRSGLLLSYYKVYRKKAFSQEVRLSYEEWLLLIQPWLVCLR